MYKTGSVVSYGSSGVCRIDGEIRQRVKGEMKQYLVLKPVFRDNSTVYIPLDNNKLMSRLKPVITDTEAEEVISAMSDCDERWISDDGQRTVLFREILSEGDVKRVAMMVHSLYMHRKSQLAKGRKLHASDEHFFKDAEQLLFDQLAHALGIQPDEVGGYLTRRLAARLA
ncbi:MAG: hypothetical protein J5994_06510 [Ruminococcus sp.]|nr:hypothetical protein [Ruminococcus sp.]